MGAHPWWHPVRHHHADRYAPSSALRRRSTDSHPCAGIAVGLGVRSTYNPNSTTANIVSGILDAFSAGILIYTGLVEVRPRSLRSSSRPR